MSGYLTSLVRRAAAPELSVRPWLSSIFGPPMPGPRVDIPMPLAEDGDAEGTIDGASPREIAETRTPRGAARSSGATESPARDAEPLRRYEATPARSERFSTRSTPVATATGTDRLSPDQTAPQHKDSVPSEEPPATERRDAIRSIEERDPARPLSLRASLRLRPQAETGGERRAQPLDADVRPVPSPAGIGAKDTATDNRDHPILTSDRSRVRQPLDGIELALRASQTEALLKPTEPPRKIERESGTESIIEATVTTPLRAPSAAVRQPLPVRARVSLPPRRDHEISERPNAPDPIIQVTIGRVEVRASTPTEPRPRPRPANGATGLDDYLRQRAGRGGS
jgi:hypothetical protein